MVTKKINLIKAIEVIVAGALLLAPLSALALSLPNCGSFSGFNCSAGNSVTGLITTVINWLLIISGVLAILFMLIGGFQYIISAGNEEAAEKGKGTVVNALIGLVIIILAYVIVNVIANLVTSAGTGAAP